MSVFILPDVHDEAGFRAWLIGVLGFAPLITALTATAIDDKAVAFLTKIIGTDATWAELYGLILSAVDAGKLGVAEGPHSELRSAAEAAAIPWPLVFSMISAIIALIKQLLAK